MLFKTLYNRLYYIILITGLHEICSDEKYSGGGGGAKKGVEGRNVRHADLSTPIHPLSARIPGIHPNPPKFHRLNKKHSLARGNGLEYC